VIALTSLPARETSLLSLAFPTSESHPCSAAESIPLLTHYALQAEGALYCGVGMLVAASLWDAWPVRQQAASGHVRKTGNCAACHSIVSTNESS